MTTRSPRRRGRDRHQRGLRGPMAQPFGPELGPWAGRVAQPPQRTNRAEYFAECVSESLERIGDHCPRALHQVTVGIEDVPDVPARSGDRDDVPLAAAVEATPDAFARVVVYRRPLEHRARSRPGLRRLVHRTVVEQLAALSGLEISTIDPDVDPDDPDDD